MTRELIAEYEALIATADDEATIDALVQQLRGDRRLTESGKARIYDSLVARAEEISRAAKAEPFRRAAEILTKGSTGPPAGYHGKVTHVEPLVPPIEIRVTGSTELVLPIATPAQARAAWDAYVAMAKALEDPADVVVIEGKPFRRKSFWRKIALAYGVDVEELGEERRLETQPSGEIRIAFYVRVRARAKNGRSFDGVGSCSSLERKGERKEHDIYATAFTRAANRAIADLVAAGEVSAEEVE